MATPYIFTPALQIDPDDGRLSTRWLLVQGRKAIASALLVVHPAKTFLCCGLKKAARNAPKRHSSRPCRAGVFATVVAQPI